MSGSQPPNNKKRNASTAGMGPPDQQSTTKRSRLDTALETKLTECKSVLHSRSLRPAWKRYDPGLFMEEMHQLSERINALDLKTVEKYISNRELAADLAALRVQEKELKQGIEDPAMDPLMKTLRETMITYVERVRACLNALAEQAGETFAETSPLNAEEPSDDSEHMEISEEPKTPDQRSSAKLQISPPSKQSNQNIEDVRAQIEEFTEELRLFILKFLEEPLPLWEPPESVTDPSIRQFYVYQKIPMYLKEPSLLMHNLEKCLQNPKVDEALQGPLNLLIYNTSGSGKTRFILECLCRTWGFYFVAKPGPDQIGSPDLNIAIHAMPEYKDWRGRINSEGSREDQAEANDSNSEVARKLVYKVLVARWIVFRCFIDTCKEKNGGILPEASKYDWVVFQTLSQKLVGMGGDPFIWCMNECLTNVEPSVLQALMARDLNLKMILGVDIDKPFLLILDEAQVASLEYGSCFLNSAGDKRLPVLRPIIQTMLEHQTQVNAKIIVSGTGFSQELLMEVLSSVVSKSAWKMMADISIFMDQNTQPSYIAKYLPPAFLQSQSGIDLQFRMQGWLQGRPRFTAHFLQKLLQGSWKESSPASPHHLLNAFVYALSNYCPIDGSPDLLAQEETVPYHSLEGIGSFQWDRISEEKGLLEDLAVALYQYIVRRDIVVLYSSRKTLVEYGLARFMGGEYCSIKEPLALVSILRHFQLKDITLVGNMRRSLQVNPGGTFEEITLYAITRQLRNWRPLNEVFSFLDGTSGLASKQGRLVARTPNGEFRPFDLVSGQPIIPSCGVAATASTAKEVKGWIDNGTEGWCLPGIFMGPDLLTWIELEDGKRILLAIQAKYYPSASKNLSAAVTASALHTINPNFYYAEIIRRHKTEEGVSKAQAMINDMLEKLEEKPKSITGGDYNILGVISALPPGNFQSAAAARELALNQHEVAEIYRSVYQAAFAGSWEGTMMIEELLRAIDQKGSHK
ncbi:hypothetical protein FRC19_011261 [Serendipita sp. 401]|nr:hypothetical protein FRC19_011261 [Serendipita sp. 401]KAG9052140.1 hypothetical protein FS842_010437 [Serendipita sp. 407]